jgi:glucose-1-phosphate adenylyltransferase
VGEGSVIENVDMSDSVIGVRSVIHGESTIRRSIVMGNDYYEREFDTGFMRPMIGSRVRIERAIIDKNVVIGEGSEIVGSLSPVHLDAPSHYIRNGIVVIPPNTRMAPGTRIRVDEMDAVDQQLRSGATISFDAQAA